MKSDLPIYRYAMDWDAFYDENPVPDVFAKTMWTWSPEGIRELQNARFLKTMEIGWGNPFYRRLWREKGIEPGDIRSLDDIVKLPLITTDDIKASELASPPFGDIQAIGETERRAMPLKVQTSGGTTGAPRATLSGPLEWELNGLLGARSLYLLGARPGDVCQIPVTLSLANLGWSVYKACHDYLGVVPVTTGSGAVTPSAAQIETAFRFGTNIWCSFPEYMTRLAQAARDECGRDFRELNAKFLLTFLGPDLEGTLRRDLEAQLGCDVYDGYGTNEVGGAAGECTAKDGLHFMEDAMFFEVCDTEAGVPVADGEIGNLVVTHLLRTVMPLIRLNLRDLGRIKYIDRCACGSFYRRMDHFLGRSDQMVKVRGVNVVPMQCLSAIKSDTRTTGEWVCVVDRFERDGVLRDELTVHVEVVPSATALDGLVGALEQRLRNDLGLGVTVKLESPGALDRIANVGAAEGKARRLVDRRAEIKKSTDQR